MTDKPHKHATIPFIAPHPDALAVYCSDGRFTDAVEALVHELGHPRLDLESASFSALETMRTGASFLIRGHATKHVILVAHEGCGYYKERYRFEKPDEIVRQQREDLRTAKKWLLGTHPDLKVSLYFAKPEGGRVAFESES
jgi:hypothetical protein